MTFVCNVDVHAATARPTHAAPDRVAVPPAAVVPVSTSTAPKLKVDTQVKGRQDNIDAALCTGGFIGKQALADLEAIRAMKDDNGDCLYPSPSNLKTEKLREGCYVIPALATYLQDLEARPNLWSVFCTKL